MKSKREVVAFLMVLVLVLSVFAGCGGSEEAENPNVGSWKLTGGYVNGVSLPKEQIQTQLGEVSLLIKEDGTVQKKGIGLDAKGIWKKTDQGVTVSDKDGSSAVVFIRKDDKLTGKIKGVELTFTKEK